MAPRSRRRRVAAAVLAEREKESDNARITVHPSDPDSTITPTAQGPFIQGYNAQAAVNADCPPQNLSPQPPQHHYRRPGWVERWQRQAELDQPAVQKLYRRRAASSEPTFHVIKRLLGFARFSLRGLAKVAARRKRQIIRDPPNILPPPKKNSTP